MLSLSLFHRLSCTLSVSLARARPHTLFLSYKSHTHYLFISSPFDPAFLSSPGLSCFPSRLQRIYMYTRTSAPPLASLLRSVTTITTHTSGTFRSVYKYIYTFLGREPTKSFLTYFYFQNLRGPTYEIRAYNIPIHVSN